MPGKKWDAAPEYDGNEAVYERLLELRGGCFCCVSPPCSAHSNPMTKEEGVALGLLDRRALATTAGTNP